MKLKSIACCLVALSMFGTSAVTFAQPGRHDQNRPEQQQSNTHNRPDRNQPNATPNQRPNNNNNASHATPNQRPSGQHNNANTNNNGRTNHSARPATDFRAGEHLPNQYRSRSYQVDNWREYDLSQPPRGHRWVQIGGDFILIAATTGVITSILLNH